MREPALSNYVTAGKATVNDNLAGVLLSSPNRSHVILSPCRDNNLLDLFNLVRDSKFFLNVFGGSSSSWTWIAGKYMAISLPYTSDFLGRRLIGRAHKNGRFLEGMDWAELLSRQLLRNRAGNNPASGGSRYSFSRDRCLGGGFARGQQSDDDGEV
jgi:hypothetical protein